MAGLTATLRLLDSGASVMLVEKEKRLGGNSAKASSGINAWTSTRTTLALTLALARTLTLTLTLTLNPDPKPQP